jgi:hypothetical protein
VLSNDMRGHSHAALKRRSEYKCPVLESQELMQCSAIICGGIHMQYSNAGVSRNAQFLKAGAVMQERVRST